MDSTDSIMILDLVESGVIKLDSQGRIVFWNKFISNASHIPIEDVKGKLWLDVFPALVKSRIDKGISKALDYNFPSILSYKLLKTQFPLYRKSLATKPPYLIDQSIIIKPVHEKGVNTGCIIYINDVSAAAKRERELSEQSVTLQKVLRNYENAKNEFEEVFESAHTGIVVFDNQGVIGRSNHAALSIFDLTDNELKAYSISHLLPEIKRFFSKSDELYSLSGIKDFVFEQSLNINGAKYLSVTISRINEDQGDFFVYITDVTDKKITEEKLISANSELEEFAYRTSHDLRSPIISTLGLIGVAKESLEREDYSTVEDCFNHSIKSLKKLDLLIKDILKLTEAKQFEEQFQPIDVKQVIDDAFYSIDQLHGFNDIDCQLKLAHDGQLVSKKLRINMILENLISNAIKYRDPDQVASKILIETYTENTNFILSISDNGLGIPEGQKHKLFKMFNRFHPKVSFGSGLGLYLMKKSAEVLGGSIVYIDQSKGAKFQLTIPQRQQHNQQQSQQQSQQHGQQHLH